jgi:hypothetical protein
MEDTRPMTVGDWMLTILVLAIPLVNLVMYLVWAFGSSGNVNRRTYCQAVLAWFAILLGVGLVLGLFSSVVRL